MTDYERLEQLAESEGILIDTDALGAADGASGYYIGFPGFGHVIFINRHRTRAEQTVALAEELGHYYRSTGRLHALADYFERRQEQIGRAWSYDQLLPPETLRGMLDAGSAGMWDVAEQTNLPEEFVREAVQYRSHHPPAAARKELPPQVSALLQRKLERQRLAAQQPAPRPEPEPEPTPDYTAQWDAIYQRGKDLYHIDRDDPVWDVLTQLWFFRFVRGRYDMIMGKRWGKYSRVQMGRMVNRIFAEYLNKQEKQPEAPLDEEAV